MGILLNDNERHYSSAVALLQPPANETGLMAALSQAIQEISLPFLSPAGCKPADACRRKSASVERDAAVRR